MKIALCGSHGLIGTALSRQLVADGNSVVPLVRHKKGSDGIYWNPKQSALNPADLEGFDAIINLAGENIAGGRWSRRRKNRIKRSRVDGNALLAATLTKLSQPPKVFISASAIGYYGDCGCEIADEDSRAGEGFLAEVCKEWEAAAEPIKELGTRLLFLRFGVVLDTKGGALAKMLPVFRLGIGGRIGEGIQYMSWISLHDAVRAVLFCLTQPELSGPVNIVAPMPVTNEKFTRSLGAALHKPARLPIPRSAIRLLFGEMGDTLLLFSSRVLPRRLLDAKFTFEQENLEQALAAILPRPS